MGDEKPVVRVRQGVLRGVRVENICGGHYYAFRGVPFAKPPVGERRFKDPEPLEEWTGVRDASKFGDRCAHRDLLLRVTVGSDDCLYLNVYTESINPKAKRPVMVWVHGGGFLAGSGNDDYYGPQYLVRKDIVLVTFNYRIGVLGFLNLEDEVATGNQGLKDQVMALKWVQENITNFGGDPNNVTIFGESAGGASVHYLLISPLARGLYHKAILQSGVATNPWASASPEPRRFAYQLSAQLGKKSYDPKTIVDFLRTVDAHKLVEEQEKILSLDALVMLKIGFGPGVDAKSPNPFLPQPPAVLMRYGVDVPMIIGYNSNEGSFFTAKVREKFMKSISDNFENVLDEDGINGIKQDGLSMQTLRKEYFGDGPITMDHVQNYSEFLADLLFLRGIHEVVGVQMDQNHPPTYLYKFCYSSDESAMKRLFNVQLKGAMHAEDLPFLFYPQIVESMGSEMPERNSVELKVSDRLVEMWTNFAKTGNPTPAKTDLLPITWKPVGKGKTYDYLKIDEDLQMESVERGTQSYDWKKLKNKL